MNPNGIANLSDVSFQGRLGIIQRLPAIYRRPFFDLLASYPGVDVSVLAGTPDGNEGVTTFNSLDVASLVQTSNRYMRSPLGMLCWQKGVREWLEEFQPEVLVMEANPRLVSNRLAISWMHGRRRTVVGWGLGELPRGGLGLTRWLRRKFAVNLVDKLDGMIAYSTKGAGDYVAMGVPTNRVFVAPNSVATAEAEYFLEEYGKDRSWVAKWRQELGLDADLLTVLFVGRLVPAKRLGRLFEALDPLATRCQLLIVGDGPARSEFENLAKDFSVRVVFAGRRTGSELAQSFLGSDVFTLPAAGGLALHEAMAYGLPVIVSFADGTEQDMVTSGVNGFVISPEDIGEYTDALQTIIENPELRRRMGEASMRVVREEFNMQKMADSLVNAVSTITVRD